MLIFASLYSLSDNIAGVKSQGDGVTRTIVGKLEEID